MREKVMGLVLVAALAVTAGCGDDGEGNGGDEIPPTALGPRVTYFGIARADDVALQPSGTDAQGRPIYVRPLGQGLSIIVEGRPGESRAPVGLDAFADDGFPDLQLIVSRPLGDGSREVCDADPADPEHQGGVPASSNFANADPINDLGCRVNDGTGQPRGRDASSEACTQTDAPGGFGFGFVDVATTVQFCLPIARAWSFPDGDTIVSARLRDLDGNVGFPAEIVVRITPPNP